MKFKICPDAAELFALLMLTIIVFPVGKSAADELERTVSTSGTGEIKAKPTLVHITLGVVSEAATAREALDQNTEAMNRVIEELSANDIAKRDIQTVGFSISPRHQSFQRGEPPKIVGYIVQNRVHITIRKVSSLGTVLDKVVTIGSNQIDNIQFSVDQPDALLDEARTQAFRDAKRKAEIYAKASGVRLGEVVSIQEGTRTAPQVRIANRSASFSGAESVPIEAGQQTLRIQVHVTWELDD